MKGDPLRAQRPIAGLALLVLVLALMAHPERASADTGAVSPRGCFADVGDPAGCGATAQGLDNAVGVAVSPDRRSVYVASFEDDAIVRFNRNPTTGALAPAGCIADVGDAAGCGTTQQGLNGATGVAVSPDGRSVYVASTDDDAIVRFDRDTITGALSPAGCIADVGDAAGCGTTAQGLNGASGVAVSPDGRSAYVASQADDAIARFERNATTGALSPAGCIADVGDAAGCGTTAQGLNAALGVAVSPDGRSVYVASFEDDAIARFDRNPTTGALSPAGCIADVGDAAGCGTTAQGMNAAQGVAVSPDGRSAYVASRADDAIARFDRNPTTGALSPAGCIADVGDAAGCGATAQGMNGASGVAVSPDGRSAYVTSQNDDAIVRFDREPVRCRGAAPTHLGTPGPDVITGTNGDDVVIAFAGADRIFTGPGRDLVCAGPGADRVFTRAGVDRALGQRGSDRIYGGGARDFLFGGPGFDRLFGGSGGDRLFGGARLDRLFGGPGFDRLFAGPGNDRAFGRAGRDLLIGHAGRDSLFGGAGRDTLRGLRGRPDRCFGGPGRDVRRARGCEIRRSIP